MAIESQIRPDPTHVVDDGEIRAWQKAADALAHEGHLPYPERGIDPRVYSGRVVVREVAVTDEATVQPKPRLFDHETAYDSAI